LRFDRRCEADAGSADFGWHTVTMQFLSAPPKNTVLSGLAGSEGRSALGDLAAREVGRGDASRIARGELPHHRAGRWQRLRVPVRIRPDFKF